MDNSKRKLCVELGILLLFVSMAFLQSNITGMVTSTAVVDASVAPATIPCVYLSSPTIFKQKDFAYMISYIENCGNQPMNITVNITALYKNTTLAETSLNVENFSLTSRDLTLPLVFQANIPYSPDPKDNYINVTMILNYTNYNNKIIKGFVRIPRKLFIITKPPLLLKPVDSEGQPKKIDKQVIRELIENNSIETVSKNTTKGFIETYSNYVQIAKENVSIPLNLSDDLNESDIDICSSNLSYLGEEVFCNITMIKGKTYILHIGYGSVHIYAEEVSDDLMEEIRQDIIEELEAEGAFNSNIIYSEDSKEVTTVVEKEAPVILMDLDATPHITLVKNSNYITFIKVKNSGNVILSDIRIKLSSPLKTNVLLSDSISLNPGESANIPIEIVPDIEGDYWIVAEVDSDKTSKKIGINIVIPSNKTSDSLKDSLENYERLMKSIEANISNYEDSEDIKSIIDDSFTIIDKGYVDYDNGEYDKVNESLDKLKQNIIDIVNKLSSKKPYIESSSGSDPSGRFILSSDAQNIATLLIIPLTIGIMVIFVLLRKSKCHACGGKINGYKCALCKRTSKDKNHKCGREHLIPKCGGCRKLEMYCKCKQRK